MARAEPAADDYFYELLTEEEAADFLGYTPRALQNWRYRGGGPQYIRISGRAVRYRRSDLIAWCDSQLEDNTS